jgi:hypothetical protein
MQQPALPSPTARFPLAFRQRLRLAPALPRPAPSDSYTPDYSSLRPRAYRPYPARFRGARQRRSFWRRTWRAARAALLIVAGVLLLAAGCGWLLPA